MLVTARSRRPVRVLLANEFGAGRGHVISLLHAALALGPGFTFEAALSQRQYDAVLAPLDPVIFDGPYLRYDRQRRVGPGAVQTANWGELLGDRGFADAARIRAVVEWWHHVLDLRRIDLLIADFAPLALVAARARGIPTIAAGQGYGLPPSHMPRFPPLLSPDAPCLHDEAELLGNVNLAIAGIGMPPLGGLPEVYHATCPMVRTLPMLDVYAADRCHPYVLPEMDISDEPADSGTEVFVYFAAQELAEPAVVDALASLPLPRRGHLPSVPSAVADRLARSGMVIEPGPVPVNLIAQRSRLILNAGQHGILCLGLFAGLPQVALPQHMEHQSNADRIAAAGVARVLPRGTRDAAGIAAAIIDLWSDDAAARRARALACDLRSLHPARPEEEARRWLAPLRDGLLSG